MAEETARVIGRMPRQLLVAFVGEDVGTWRVQRFTTVRGMPLAPVSHITMVEGPAAATAGRDAVWVLRGITSHERYVTGAEHEALAARQQGLGRPQATRAALIPITKSEQWYELPQDERRRIFEDRSRHIATGLEYLPAVARRLHHGRERGETFDFLTWFEYAPEAGPAFEQLVARLRATEEWTYVVREIDLRLELNTAAGSLADRGRREA
jgi:Chlorite dismutase